MTKRLLDAINQGLVHIFYKSEVWLKKRREILKRDHYECQHCKKKGEYTKADCVHHIKHLRKFPHLALENFNLISLCNACHNIEHPEKRLKTSLPRFTNEERWE